MQQLTTTTTKTKLSVITGILAIFAGATALIAIPALQSPDELNPREVYTELSAACSNDTCKEKIQECFDSECGNNMIECLFYWTKDQCGFLPESEYPVCELTMFGTCAKQVTGSALAFTKPAQPTIPKNPQLADLLHQEKITQAVGSLSKSEQDFLYASFNQLETGNTEIWKEFDEPKYLSQEETRKIWLRRVAFALYVEVYKKVPWSLLAYPQEHINWLLSYCIKNGNDPFVFMPHACGQFFGTTDTDNKYIVGMSSAAVWSANPLQEFQIGKELVEAKEIVKDIPDVVKNIETPGNAIDKIIVGMRKIGWKHLADYELGVFAPAIESVYQKNSGTCHINSFFLSNVLRSWNIPAQLTTMVTPGSVHSGIYFPTEGHGLVHGDDIQSGFYAKLPVSATYESFDIMSAAYNKPTCEGEAFVEKLNWLHFLSYYNDPEYQSRVYFSRQFDEYDKSICSDKNFWENLVTSTASYYCKNPKPLFSPQEISTWKQTITAHDQQYNICGKVSGLVLPLPPVSKISIAVNDPIKQVEAILKCYDNGNYGIPLPDGPTPHTFIIHLKNLSEEFGPSSCKKGSLEFRYYDEKYQFIGIKLEGEFPFTLP